MHEIKIVKPKIWNFELVKGENAWKEVVYSARMSGVPENIPAEEVFRMIVKNDYGSALEHIIIKFDVKITKGNAPELLEHRIASHSGYSTRYIKVYKGIDKEKPVYEVILPPNLMRDAEKKEAFIKTVSKNLQLYESLLASGVPKESARYILPFCLAVGIYHFTINLRSLLNLLGLRLCVRASPEFRCIASQLYFNLLNELPLLRGLVGCRGLMRGACPESDVTGVRVGKQHPSYPPCPFRNRESEIFIPTIKELQSGIDVKEFNVEKAVEVQERIFKRWADWR
ncbi:FAD-dependent thymidylate synthase [Candidatus Bathyarchaeota archaeon]|nr:FAD-dependent thymidylate synthase [Candidatus Bathyarchaeota archaeon]